ncbi:MAG: hypothetical protein AB7L92_05535, partial [Alphaproteobacteria bacterium]
MKKLIIISKCRQATLSCIFVMSGVLCTGNVQASDVGNLTCDAITTIIEDANLKCTKIVIECDSYGSQSNLRYNAAGEHAEVDNKTADNLVRTGGYENVSLYDSEGLSSIKNKLRMAGCVEKPKEEIDDIDFMQ